MRVNKEFVSKFYLPFLLSDVLMDFHIDLDALKLNLDFFPELIIFAPVIDV